MYRPSVQEFQELCSIFVFHFVIVVFGEVQVSTDQYVALGLKVTNLWFRMDKLSSFKEGDSEGGMYVTQRKTFLSVKMHFLLIFNQIKNSPVLINSIEGVSSDLYHISIPPESLPCVIPFHLVDGRIISL